MFKNNKPILMAIQVLDISNKRPEDFPGLIISAINDYININKCIIFPCNCTCCNNKINIYLSPTNDGYLNNILDNTFTFEYSIENDNLFPFGKVINYYLDISHYKMVQLTIYFNQSCCP